MSNLGASESLKPALASEPVIAIPKCMLPIMIHTDDIALAAVLSQ